MINRLGIESLGASIDYMARFVECECGEVSEGETIGDVLAAHGEHLATAHTTQRMSEHLADVG